MKKSLWLLVVALVVALCAVSVSAEATATLPETCPHCNKAVTWEAVTEAYTAKYLYGGKHYYLAFEGEEGSLHTLSVPKTVCLYMNGKTLKATGDRALSVSGTLNLIGEGTVAGRGFTAAGTNYGGAVRVLANGTTPGTLNVYGTTITTTAEEGRTAARGGVVYVENGTLNLYSGSITGGVAANGGTLGIDIGVANIYGGTLGGGTATAAGGSVYIRTGGTLNVAGGTVEGGTAQTTGGAVHAHIESTLRVTSGSISGGVAGTNGGTLFARGSSMEIAGGTLGGGKAGNAGGSVYINKGCSLKVSGGKITAGHKDTSSTGPCVWVPENANITLAGSGSVAEIRFPAYDPAALTVEGAYTGSAQLRCASSGQTDDGVVVGTSVDANLRGGNISVYNTEYYVIHKGTDIIMSTVGYVDPLDSKEAYCPVCKKNVTWLAYTANEYAYDSYMYTGHYYLAEEGDDYTWKSKFIVGNDRVCLDLNGKALLADQRAFDVTKGTLNIMDTVGGGLISGQGPVNVATVYGGTLFIREESDVNLYSGLLTYRLPTDGRSYVSRGGVAYVRGQFNIYGGEVSGGAAAAGGNLYADAAADYVGHIGMYGGVVGENVKVPGKSTSGKCIVSRGTVTLSGAPEVVSLMLSSNDYTPALHQRITLENAFTGTVSFSVSDYDGSVCIGSAVNGDLTGSDLSFTTDEAARVLLWNDRLLCVAGNPGAILFAQSGAAVAYETAQAAVNAATVSDKVVLWADAGDLQVDSLVHVDLNGFDITGSVTGSGILMCMDSKTDDFTVADGDYGKITGQVSCQLGGVSAEAACSADNYLMISEEEGISFHRVGLQITNSVLRPASAGIYYNSSFAGDEMITANVASFGIALNVAEIPNAENMETTSLYTVMDKALFNSDSTSCLLSGIMKEENEDADNLSQAAMPVYSNAYVRLTDGRVLFGSAVATSLQEQTAAIDAGWIQMNLTQKRAYVAMFEKFDAVMRDSSWSVANALSVVNRKVLFASTDYTPYLAPWTHDVVAEAKSDGKIHYYFMAGEGLHISDAQTYKDKWGDSCLIVFPNGQTLLIDVGPLAYAPVLARNLERMGITHLDAILITHPHSDHHNGAFSDAAILGVGLLETITVDKVYYRGGYDLTSKDATLVARTCTDLGLDYAVMDKGDVLNFGDVRMECVWPLEGEGDAQISGGQEVNNMSIVVRFDYGEHSSLFTGDLYLSGEEMILERVDNSLLDVDLLKVPHHGYATSNSIAFIEAVSPEVGMTTGRLPIPARIRNRYESLGVTFLDDRTNGYVSATGSADGTLEYVAARNAATEEVPDAGDDVVPDGSED